MTSTTASPTVPWAPLESHCEPLKWNSFNGHKLTYGDKSHLISNNHWLLLWYLFYILMVSA